MDSFIYVPWYSPQFGKGIWYYPYCPVPVLPPQESPNPPDFLRAQTPLQALNTTNFPKITSPELRNLNTNTINFSDRSKGKFFVMLSQCEDDVHKSLKYGIWTSTHKGNHILNEMYMKYMNKEPIYLFFSVIGSGMFVGVGEMISRVNFTAIFNGWYPDFSNLGYFGVRWIYVKDIGYNKLKFIKYNQRDSIINATDCQEIPRPAGFKALKVFESARQFRSILEDFKYYDNKEEVVLSTLVN